MLLEASLASGRHTHRVSLMQTTESLRHVLNGDAMQPSFEQSGIDGAWTSWREAVIDGPVAVDMASAESCAARAQALADLSGIDARAYVDDFEQRERFLAACPDGCELVLWFEADSFCELHLLDLLGRTHARPEIEVAVVHVPTLSIAPEALRASFERRHVASLVCRNEAREAWRHYCELDPRIFAGWRGSDPWLNPIVSALQHDFVGRFADARGLSCFDACMLERLVEGRASPLELFELSRNDPTLARLGLGDLQVWIRLEDLARRGAILLHEPLPRDAAPTREPTIEATSLGHAALGGETIMAPPRGPIGGADPTQWHRAGDSLIPS